MKVNQLKAGVILSYVSLLLGNAISLVYTPIMLRLLGQSEYGLYQLVSSIVTYLGLLSFGFGSAYIRYYSIYKVNKEDEKIAKLNGMFITVFSVVAILALICGAFLVLNTSHIFSAKLTPTEIGKAKTLMSILVFSIALSFPFSIFNSYIVANEQYLFQRIIGIIKSVVNPLIILPILFMGYKSIGLVISITILNIIADLSNTAFCFIKLKIRFDFKKFEFKLFKQIAIFSFFIFLNIITDQINWSVDKFLLGIFQGTVAVAVYGLASQLNLYYMSFSTSISTVFIPKINQLVVSSDDSKTLSNLFAKIGRIQFIVLSLILSEIIFFGSAFISLWAGQEYKESFLILLILIIPLTVPLIQSIGIEIQKAKNMHKFRSITYFFIAVINILVSVPLCKLYGGVGCAVGTAISFLIGNGVIMNIYYKRKIGLDIKYFWIEVFKILPSFVLPIIFGVIVINFVNLSYVLNFILFSIIYFLLFCVSMWLFGLNKYEKELFVKPLMRVANKFNLVKS